MAYQIADIDKLRADINKEFLIRLEYPKEKRTELVGFTTFCEKVGNLHAEHYSKKALKSIQRVPRFKGRAGALAVVFYPR